GYIRVNGNAPLPNIILHSHNFSVAGKNAGYSSMGDYGKLNYPKAQHHTRGELAWFRQKTCQDLEFAVIIGIKKTKSCLLLAALFNLKGCLH
ncbi:MAG: hypothetical protein NT148_01825, partial [Candidatus Nealsonbacteria bacterium]|nr:hypothetical protein [Candidatus Nealsonbacteria bacterium]